MNYDKKNKKIDFLRYYLLILAESNSEINNLLGFDYDFLDIKLEMREMLRQKLIDDSTGHIEVTKKGKKEKQRLRNYYKIGNINSLIVPDLNYSIEKLDMDEVYLP